MNMKLGKNFDSISLKTDSDYSINGTSGEQVMLRGSIDFLAKF